MKDTSATIYPLSCIAFFPHYSQYFRYAFASPSVGSPSLLLCASHDLAPFPSSAHPYVASPQVDVTQCVVWLYLDAKVSCRIHDLIWCGVVQVNEIVCAHEYMYVYEWMHMCMHVCKYVCTYACSAYLSSAWSYVSFPVGDSQPTGGHNSFASSLQRRVVLGFFSGSH